MRVQLRIVAGSLRGRKLNCEVHEGLRPTPQMVREALFSILGNAVPERPFFDVFAGSGALGMEAVSRGGSEAVFVERDLRLASAIDRHLREFGIADRASVVRTDVYRWAERWHAPTVPVNIFISPPFADYEHRLDSLQLMLAELEPRRPPPRLSCFKARSRPASMLCSSAGTGTFASTAGTSSRSGSKFSPVSQKRDYPNMTAREFAISVVRRLREAGFQALWAGGCVRDELLGLTPHDYDVATNARPEQVRAVPADGGRRNELRRGHGHGAAEQTAPSFRLKSPPFAATGRTRMAGTRTPSSFPRRRRTRCVGTSPSTACSWTR